MKKEHLIILGVAVVGAYLYMRHKKNKTANAASTANSSTVMAEAESEEETLSEASGTPTGGSCIDRYSTAQCTTACTELYGGTLGSDRKCYVNGRAVSGGIFGTTRRAISRRN
jgi:hypothetical protein